MLLPRKSGKETRALIKDKVGEETECLKQRGAVVRQTAARWVDKGKESLSPQKGSLNDGAETEKKTYRDAAAG